MEHHFAAGISSDIGEFWETKSTVHILRGFHSMSQCERILRIAALDLNV